MKINISIKYWILLLAMPLLLLQGCFDYEDVEFKGVKDVSLAERTDENLKIKIAVGVNNPNKFNIKIKKSTLDVFVNGKYAGKATLDKAIVIQKNKEDVYDVYMNANTKEIMKVAMGSLGSILKGNVEIGVKGKVKGSVYGITRSMDVDMKENVNLKDFL